MGAFLVQASVSYVPFWFSQESCDSWREVGRERERDREGGRERERERVGTRLSKL